MKPKPEMVMVDLARIGSGGRSLIPMVGLGFVFELLSLLAQLIENHLPWPLRRGG